LAALSKENEKESAGERRWFVTLSDALVRGHPFLGITHAFTLMTTNQWERQGDHQAHGMRNEMPSSDLMLTSWTSLLKEV
jgi:hypothetical protein